MRGVVLSGGAGTRLRPITFAMAKQLVPVANQPILFYGLKDLAAAGIGEVVIVVSPETGAEVRAAVDTGQRFGLDVEYVEQDRPLGLAHALRLALPFVDGHDCLMYLGDNIVRGGVAGIVADFEAHRPNAQILLAEVANPSAFGVAELDPAGRVVRLVEKPRLPPSRMALVGVYLFDHTVGDAVEAIAPSARGEYEITDAIQYLIDKGREVRASMVSGWWKDTGHKEDLLHANELVLSDLAADVQGDLVDCRVEGPVRVGKGSRLVGCTVYGPVVVGEGAELARSTIGPNTTIGNGCSVLDAAIEESLVMDNVTIHSWKLHHSLIGRDSQVGGSAPGSFVELTIGERSEIVG